MTRRVLQNPCSDVIQPSGTLTIGSWRSAEAIPWITILGISYRGTKGPIKKPAERIPERVVFCALFGLFQLFCGCFFGTFLVTLPAPFLGVSSAVFLIWPAVGTKDWTLGQETVEKEGEASFTNWPLFSSVSVFAQDGSKVPVFGSDGSCGERVFSVHLHHVTERHDSGSGSGFGSSKTVPAVSVPGKTVPTIPVSGSASVPVAPWF